MNGHDGAVSATFEWAYLALSGMTTAARCPALLRKLVSLGFSSVIALPTPSACRVIPPRDLADVEGVRVVESYFDAAIRPRPPHGVTLFAPCSFNSLNKLAGGIADNLTRRCCMDRRGRRINPITIRPQAMRTEIGRPSFDIRFKT